MPRMVIIITMILARLAGSEAMAADNNLSVCLDTATKLEAGGFVDEKKLIAAHRACERANVGARDAATRMKVGVAVATIDDGYRQRAASHHSN